MHITFTFIQHHKSAFLFSNGLAAETFSIAGDVCGQRAEQMSGLR
jgi:hypothetical protein